ncbi:MAG TPA: membrane dipeptidase [Firmicutes bacterium]|nr:membrane dipeptidase [Bacillota bacterium]
MKLTPAQEERAQRLHRQALVWDSHCDTLMDIAAGRRTLGQGNAGGHLDLPRLQQGGVKVQIFAIYIESPPYLRRTLEFIGAFYRELEQNRGKLTLAGSMAEIEAATLRGEVAAILSIEGGEALEGGPAILPCLYRLGVRALGLTWNHRNQLADGIAEARTGGGLTTLGLETVAEMNRLGMVIDVSHLSPAGFWDVLEHSRHPVIASHSNARGLYDHPRNLDDDQIRALAARGGVMGINFSPAFLGPAASLETVLDQIDYIARLAGCDCIGLGSDYDGIAATPRGLEDVSLLPNITRGLVARGYSDQDILKILGGNFARVFARVIG